jgi:hypothetical protein
MTPRCQVTDFLRAGTINIYPYCSSRRALRAAYRSPNRDFPAVHCKGYSEVTVPSRGIA